MAGDKRGRKPAFNAVQERYVVRRWKHDLARADDLAIEMGVSIATIYKCLRKHGATKPNPARLEAKKEAWRKSIQNSVRKPPRKNWSVRAREMYTSAECPTLDRIGTVVGVSAERVRQVAKRDGWVRQPRPRKTQKMGPEAYERHLRLQRAILLWQKVRIHELDACWIWIGGFATNGTPRTRVRHPESAEKIMVGARAWLYQLCRGPVDLFGRLGTGAGRYNELVLPECGRRDCVNPWHAVKLSRAEFASAVGTGRYRNGAHRNRIRVSLDNE